jgi:hypothetical protein
VIFISIHQVKIYDTETNNMHNIALYYYKILIVKLYIAILCILLVIVSQIVYGLLQEHICAV